LTGVLNVKVTGTGQFSADKTSATLRLNFQRINPGQNPTGAPSVAAQPSSLSNIRRYLVLTLGRTRKFIPHHGTRGGGGMEPLLGVFDMLQYFETILPFVESILSS